MGAKARLLDTDDIRNKINADREMLEDVLSLMNILYVTGNNSFGYLSRKELKILVPDYFKDLLCRAISEIYHTPFNNSGIMEYKGIIVESGYENALVIFHKDAPLMLDNKLSAKVELSGKILMVKPGK